MLFWILAFILLFLLLGTDNADASTVTSYVAHSITPLEIAVGCIGLVLIGGLVVLWWAAGTKKQPPHPAYLIKQGSQGSRTVFRYFRWDMENQEWVFLQTYDHLFEATQHRNLTHVSDYVGDTYYLKDGRECDYQGRIVVR